MEIKDSNEIGDIIYRHMRENVIMESSEWALSRVKRVTIALHAARPGKRRFVVKIPWISEFQAFTASGQYIFINRCFFQSLRNDDMLAFIVAHEIAHHDLGHIRLMPNWLARLSALELNLIALIIYGLSTGLLRHPEQEAEADRYALALSLRAGFDGDKCIDVFGILKRRSLDMRDHCGVYGPDDDFGLPLDLATWSGRFRQWLYERGRGYHSITERRERLRNQLQRTRSRETAC